MSFADLYTRMKARRAPAAPAAPGVNWNDSGSIIAGQGATAATAGQYGSDATADYYKRISSFDPTAAVNKYASGAWAAAKGGPGGFDDTLARLKGEAAGGGRLNSGFYDQDVGDLYRKTVSDYSAGLDKTALDATRMQMVNNEAIGQFGQDETGLNLELGSGRAEQLINDAREKAARRRQRKRGIGGLIGGVAGGVGGFVLSGGNPAGAFEGWKLGSAAGGSF